MRSCNTKATAGSDSDEPSAEMSVRTSSIVRFVVAKRIVQKVAQRIHRRAVDATALAQEITQDDGPMVRELALLEQQLDPLFAALFLLPA